MKTYKAIQLRNSDWAIKHGRTSKGMINYSHRGGSEAETREQADKLTADALIAEARRLVKGLTWEHACLVAHDAYDIASDVEVRGIKENPAYDSSDSFGFLA